MRQKKFLAAVLAAATVLFSVVPAAGSPQSPIWAGSVDLSSGRFSVSARLPEEMTAESVYFPVWAQGDQSDIVWYQGDEKDGVWKADISLADHSWHGGPYTVHCYADLADGRRVLIGGTDAAHGRSEGSLTAWKLGSTQPMILLHFTDALLNAFAPVSFYVTTEDGTRIGPFAASKTRDGWGAVIPGYRLGTGGNCSVQAYIGSSAVPAALAAFHLEETKSGTVRVDNSDSSAGTFRIRAAFADPANVETLRAAVWTTDDQSDIRWADMEPDGTDWILNTHVRDFGHAFGTYNIHVYALLKSGELIFTDGITFDFEPVNYLYGTAQGETYTLHLLGASESQPPTARVWSAVYGSNDRKDYAMDRQGNGSWTAQVNASDHPDGRTLEVSVYAGNTCLASMSYPEMEATTGHTSQAAEEHLQMLADAVYAEVGTDLHDVYAYVRDHITYVHRDGHVTPPEGYTREQWYAVEGFETFQGNCYTYASTFYELATRLGYEAQYIEGEVPSTAGWIGHGFVIVTIDGERFICDAVFEHSSTTGKIYYMQSVEKPRTTYRW